MNAIYNYIILCTNRYNNSKKIEDKELVLNTEITESEVCAILKSYGVPDKVHNINLYKRAFIHKSYCKRSLLYDSIV